MSEGFIEGNSGVVEKESGYSKRPDIVEGLPELGNSHVKPELAGKIIMGNFSDLVNAFVIAASEFTDNSSFKCWLYNRGLASSDPIEVVGFGVTINGMESGNAIRPKEKVLVERIGATEFLISPALIGIV